MWVCDEQEITTGFFGFQRVAIYQDTFSDVVLQPFSEYGYRNTIGLILLTQVQVASQQLLDRQKEREVGLSSFSTKNDSSKKRLVCNIARSF